MLLIYLIIFQLGIRSSKISGEKSVPVSVIIAARNEEKNIKDCLTSIIDQNYPNFEVILIDDHSTDKTISISQTLRLEFPDLQIIRAKNHGKKFAIQQGIHQAQNEYLLFTDADCQPRSANWISKMISYFDQETSFVLGYSPYRSKRNLTNYLQRYETLLTACLYVSAVHFYKPYMAVGRNLAYRKSVFLKSDQFQNHLDILSGDDDLLIQQMATLQNTKICLDTDAFVDSKPKQNLKQLFRQKLRHISTADHYKSKDRFLLGLFYTARLGTLTGFFFLIILTDQQLIATLSILGYFILLQIAFFHPCKKLGLSKINWYIPLLEVLLVIFQLGLFIYKLFSSKKIRWK